MPQEPHRWAVVTGASSGIGRAIALEAAKRGYAVAAAARREAELEALCDEIKRTHGVDARPIPVDLATAAGARRLHDATRDLNVRLVVANAGLSAIGDYADLPVAKIEQMAGVNMISVAVLCRLYGATLPEGGQLVVTSSMTAYVPLPGAALYGATRAFVHSLAGALAIELRARKVGVHCLLPGATDTGFAAESQLEKSLAFTGPLFRPLKVVTTAEDVARAALDSLDRSSCDVIPSFMQRCYALAARALMPRFLACAFSGYFFGEVSPLHSVGALVEAFPVLLPGAVLILLAIPLVVAQDAWYRLRG